MKTIGIFDSTTCTMIRRFHRNRNDGLMENWKAGRLRNSENSLTLSLTLNLLLLQHSIIPYASEGRLAQLDRALVSGTKGRGFNSRIARHIFFSKVYGYEEMD